MDSINNACKLGSDAWLELQAFKTRQLNRREKLNRHKNLHKDLINGLVTTQNNHLASTSSSQQSIAGSSTPSTYASNASNNNNNNNANIINQNSAAYQQQQNPRLKPLDDTPNSVAKVLIAKNNEVTLADNLDAHQISDFSITNAIISNNNTISSNDNSISLDNIKPSASNVSPPTTINLHSKNFTNQTSTTQQQTSDVQPQEPQINLELVECLLLLKLCDVALKLPIDSRSLQRSVCKIRGLETATQSLIENLLQKFAHQELIALEEPTDTLIGRRKKQQAILQQHLAGPACQKLTQDYDDGSDESCIYVTSADQTKLVEFDKSYGSLENIRALLLESKVEELNGSIEGDEHDLSTHNQNVGIHSLKSNTNNVFDERNGTLECKRQQNQLQVQNYDSNAKSNPSNGPNIKNSNSGSNSSSSTSSNIKKQQQDSDDLESLLSLSSTRERESKKLGEELLELLSKPTAKERNLLERFRSADGYQVQEFCPKGTKGECNKNNKGAGACEKLHFKKIIAKHTEESLGDCSFLNTCFHMDSCKYVHYEVDYGNHKPQKTQNQHQFKRPHPAESHNKSQRTHDSAIDFVVGCSRTSSSAISVGTSKDDKSTTNTASKISVANAKTTALSNAICLPGPATSSSMYTLTPEEQSRIDAKNRKRFKTVLYPPQWIQCDLRFFDMSLLGKFSVVMADPPWDIHMELPYGTMSDDEMRKLNIPALQDEGVIFLWVTGRAMELGRECLALWGYDRCDEIIWVKTNQLQRIIRTGRTGHWLNHGKEHCLVGVKGNPKDINRGLDCDVIVAEVRATSHKPDEIYGIIERLSPGTRKIELFGRAHNVQPNWITLGNQLNGVKLIEPSLVNAFKKLNLPFQKSDTVT